MKRLFIFLWPPYGFYLTKKVIAQKAGTDDPWELALEEFKINIPLKFEDKLAEAEKIASSVLEAENKRKDVLESKAATFVVTPAIATAITAAIAPLTKDLGLTNCTATLPQAGEGS